MSELFTLVQIEDRTRVPLERLRYVIDANILPGRRHGVVGLSLGRGIARRFDAFEAFGIVTAVLMLDGGMRRNRVMDCLDLLCDYPDKGRRQIRDIPLYQAFSNSEIVALEVGDGLNVRLVTLSGLTKSEHLNIWIQVETRGHVTNFDPLVTTRINVVRLRDCFQK